MDFVVVLATLILPHPLPALDLPHYDSDSLAYLSTDIVTATLTVDSQKRITATVTDVFYGDLKSGDRLDTLSPFLSFFRPMDDGQRVILFLDRRPRKSDFFNAEGSKSPFAVVPSGVYLIDEYEHVHEYYQESNPGLYAAQGYRFFIGKVVPTREQNLALPSLSDVRQRITASLKYVDPLRGLLDKDPTAKDAPALLNLLETSAKRRRACESDAIIERIGNQLRSLQDPEIALRSFSLAPDWRSPMAFVNNGGNRDVAYTAARANFLLLALADRKREIALRVAALEILLDISRFRSGPQTGPSQSLPIDNEWLRGIATEIQSTAKSIFDDEAEDGHLRSLALQFVAIDQPTIAADVKRVYEKTAPDELRFAVEVQFLRISDASYERLNPPGGPIASIILAAPVQHCIKANGDNVAFVMKYHLRKDYNEKSGSPGMPQIVLRNVRTGQRFTSKFTFLAGWSGTLTGETWFELTPPLEVPAGEYSLSAEFGRNDQVFSRSRGQVISIVETRSGRRVVVK